MSPRNARLPNPLRVNSADVSRAMRWSIGQAVTVTNDDGALINTQTRSAPFRSHGTWMIFVAGVAPGVSPLARVHER